jgi:cobalt-zinc-cadmium efflux system membrane fusion protein
MDQPIMLDRPLPSLSPPERSGGLFKVILQGFPTLLVLIVAAGIGWWGHHNGWKLPKFSELKGQVAAKDDWCAEHNVPESICIECDESLLPREKAVGWCKIHGIPECTLCNPQLAQLPKIPTITTADLERARESLAFAERISNTSNCTKHLRRIQFATSYDAEKAGIVVDPVWLAPATEFIATSGEIGYDQTRIAHLSSRTTGTVWKVFKHLGDDVQAGDILALIDSAEVGKAKAELLQAFASLQLKVQTLASLKDSAGAIPEARLREAEAAVREAEIRVGAGCQSLTNLGLTLLQSEVRSLDVDQLQAKLHFLGIPTVIAATLPKTSTSNLLPLVAPLEGRVMSREMVAGEVVDTTRILFHLVDTRHLWLTLDVKGEEASRVAVGQKVRFTPDNGRAELVATLAWRNSQADPKTRTVKVRADLHDPEQKLVSNTFGSGKVILREVKQAVSVPKEAVQWDGCCHVLFVRDKDYLKPESPKLYHVRKVRIGARDEKNAEVIAGVLPGELVVTKGSGLLLTELLRSELGEGCACCHPK